MEEMYNEIDKVLATKYSDESDRQQMMVQYGESMILAVMTGILESIQNESLRSKMVEAINNQNEEEINNLLDEADVDMDKILKEKHEEIFSIILSDK